MKEIPSDTDIEIVVVRVPEDATEVTVFEGGRDVTALRGVRVYVINPDGASVEDWQDARREAIATASPKVAEVLARAYDRYADSEWLDGV